MTLEQFRALKAGEKVRFRGNEYTVVSVSDKATLLHNFQIGLVILRKERIGKLLKEWGWELSELEKI